MRDDQSGQLLMVFLDGMGLEDGRRGSMGKRYMNGFL